MSKKKYRFKKATYVGKRIKPLIKYLNNGKISIKSLNKIFNSHNIKLQALVNNNLRCPEYPKCYAKLIYCRLHRTKGKGYLRTKTGSKNPKHSRKCPYYPEKSLNKRHNLKKTFKGISERTFSNQVQTLITLFFNKKINNKGQGNKKRNKKYLPLKVSTNKNKKRIGKKTYRARILKLSHTFYLSDDYDICYLYGYIDDLSISPHNIFKYQRKYKKYHADKKKIKIIYKNKKKILSKIPNNRWRINNKSAKKLKNKYHNKYVKSYRNIYFFTVCQVRFVGKKCFLDYKYCIYVPAKNLKNKNKQKIID